MAKKPESPAEYSARMAREEEDKFRRENPEVAAAEDRERAARAATAAPAKPAAQAPAPPKPAEPDKTIAQHQAVANAAMQCGAAIRESQEALILAGSNSNAAAISCNTGRKR